MYYCKKCHEIYEYKASPFELKCVLNPILAIKKEWDEEDWKAPIALCHCGGEIDAGHPKNFANISMGEHERLSWSLGCDEAQLPEMQKIHPGAEWRQSPEGGGYQMIIKNRTEKKKRMKERGFEEY